MAEVLEVDSLLLYFGIVAIIALGVMIYLYFFQKKNPKLLETEFPHTSGNAVWIFGGDEGTGYTSKVALPRVEEGLADAILEDGTKLVKLDIGEIKYPKKNWNIAFGAGTYPVFCSRDKNNVRRDWLNISEEKLMHLSQKALERYKTQAKVELMHSAEIKDKRKGESSSMYEEILSRRGSDEE